MSTRPNPLHLVAAGALALIACTSLRTPSHADAPASPSEPGYILVDGIASIQVVPDIVDLSLTLTAEHDDPKRAVAALRAQQGALLEALEAAGGADAKLHAGQLQLSTRWRDHSAHERPYYVASLTVVACLTEFDRMGAVLAAGAEHGVTAASSRYRSTQLPEKKKAVRELALRAAADKAAQSAELMGARLGAVTAIEEVGSRSGGWGMVSNNYEAAPSGGGSDGVLMPGAIDLSLTVEVRYALSS